MREMHRRLCGGRAHGRGSEPGPAPVQAGEWTARCVPLPLAVRFLPDLPRGVMDALRQAAYERGLASPEQARTLLFQKAFLRNTRRHGRLNEIELIGLFKTSVFLNDLSVPFLFKDAMLAPRTMARGKFSP